MFFKDKSKDQVTFQDMEGDATAERRYLQSPVSALKYLQRPSDPLKDGSIFQIGPRLSRNSAGLPLTDTRQSASLGISQSLGPPPSTPSQWFTATPGAQLQTPDTGQLSSRVDVARQIRANFDNLVRASPLPRAVERLVTPSAGRLAALAPPEPWWRQGSPIYGLEDANTTPQHPLHIKPQLQPGFLSPAPRSMLTDAPHTAPVSTTPSGQDAGTPSHPPFAIIRPIPLAPSFRPLADALYTPRPTGRGRDPRGTRSSAHAAPASAPGITQAQPEPAIPEAPREPIAEATKQISTGAKVHHEESLQRGVPEAPAPEATQSDSGRTVTNGAAAQARAEEQRRQQDQHQSPQSRRSPRTSFLATREAEPAVSSPQQQQADALGGNVHLEASGAAPLPAQSPARAGVGEQAHVMVPKQDHATCTARTLPGSQASKVPRGACQSNQQELLCVEQLKPDSPSGAAHGSSCDGQQGAKAWEDQPIAPIGNSRGVQLLAQAADAGLESRPVETRVAAAQIRSCAPQHKPKSKRTESSEAGTIVAQVQVSRTGRVRAPPLAFWANERISRNADPSGGSAIERGFSDRLAQQCGSFVQSPSGKKPKKVVDTAEPGKGKGSKATQTQRQSAELVERRKAMKRKHPEAEQRPAAFSQSADATTLSVPLPTVSPSSPAQRGETLAAERSLVEKPDGRKPRGYQCELCQKRKQGHCGTEKAIKACLRRKLGQTAQPGVPAAPAQAPQVADRAERHNAALPKEPILGRTLGVAAQLHALSRRPSDAGGAAQASAAAQAGQKLDLLGQHKPPAKINSKGSLQAHQPEQKDTRERVNKKQRAAGKQANLSVRGSEETLTDRSAAAEKVRLAAAAPANASERINTSEDKRATKGKRAKVQTAWALEDAGVASASHTASDMPKRKASAATHDSLSSAPMHGGSSKSKLGKGSGPSEKAPSSKLRKLTKAGNTATAKQKVQKLDLGANASSGTSNEEDDAMPDDGDDWSDEQATALQRAYLVAEDPTVTNFWHKVAQHVPGKTAQECHDKLWAEDPTPKRSKGGNPGACLLAAEADSDNSPLMAPPRKNAAGGSKKPAPGATRKWVRQVRWQERATQAASAAGASQQPDASRAAARSSANPTLLAAMQQQQRTDRYIDALIRKRGPLHKWAKGATARRVVPIVAPMSLSHPELQGAVAAIASATQGTKDAEADEEASDHDQYWSDDC